VPFRSDGNEAAVLAKFGTSRKELGLVACIRVLLSLVPGAGEANPLSATSVPYCCTALVMAHTVGVRISVMHA
jgi:hypothetical protein